MDFEVPARQRKWACAYLSAIYSAPKAGGIGCSESEIRDSRESMRTGDNENWTCSDGTPLAVYSPTNETERPCRETKWKYTLNVFRLGLANGRG